MIADMTTAGRHMAAGAFFCAGLAAGVFLLEPTVAIGAERAAGPVAVAVGNASKPVLCAEEDNVTLTFTSDKVRRFRIEAVHPVYLAALDKDNWDADWTACDFGPAAEVGEPAPKTEVPAKPPERVTLYESADKWLVGLRFPNFWRESEAVVRVGENEWRGLHLMQLWRVRPNGGEEVLVLYPQDGYWRARPKAPRGRELTAFGSSFLIGPVETKGRPIVRLKEILYHPDSEAETFALTFAAGGAARVLLTEVSETRLALDVELGAAVKDLPFAAMRSMYVTAFNNDVERVAIRPPKAKGWAEAGIMDFKGGDALEVWAGRRAISQHNTSSPDMIFEKFSAQ